MIVGYLYSYLFENGEGIDTSDVSGQLAEIADSLSITGELSSDNYASLLSVIDRVNGETSNDNERVVLYQEVFNAYSFGLDDSRVSKIKAFLDAAYNSSQSAQEYKSRNATGIATFISETFEDVGEVATDATKRSSWFVPGSIAAAFIAYKILK